MREYIDDFEESCFVIGGEDAVKAKGVMWWTIEQFYTAYMNLDSKIERIKKEREKARLKNKKR